MLKKNRTSLMFSMFLLIIVLASSGFASEVAFKDKKYSEYTENVSWVIQDNNYESRASKTFLYPRITNNQSTNRLFNISLLINLKPLKIEVYENVTIGYESLPENESCVTHPPNGTEVNETCSYDIRQREILETQWVEKEKLLGSGAQTGKKHKIKNKNSLSFKKFEAKDLRLTLSTILGSIQKYDWFGTGIYQDPIVNSSSYVLNGTLDKSPESTASATEKRISLGTSTINNDNLIIAWWNLSESASPYIDQHSGFELTCDSCPARHQSADNDYWQSFTNDMINISNNQLPYTKNFTILIKFNATNPGGSDDFAGIVESGFDGVGFDNFSISVRGSGASNVATYRAFTASEDTPFSLVDSSVQVAGIVRNESVCSYYLFTETDNYLFSHNETCGLELPDQSALTQLKFGNHTAQVVPNYHLDGSISEIVLLNVSVGEETVRQISNGSCAYPLTNCGSSATVVANTSKNVYNSTNMAIGTNISKFVANYVVENASNAYFIEFNVSCNMTAGIPSFSAHVANGVETSCKQNGDTLGYLVTLRNLSGLTTQIPNLTDLNITLNPRPTWNQTPQNQTYEYPAEINYQVNATSSIGVDGYQLNDTTNFQFATGTRIIQNATLLQLGTYWLNVTVNDTSNNQRSEVLNITVVDTTTPSVHNISDTPDPVEYNTSINFTANVSDLHSVDEVNISVNGTNYTTARSGETYMFAINATQALEANIEYYFLAWDNSSNMNRSTINTFFINDTIKPNANVTAPSNNIYQQSRNVTFNYTTWDIFDANETKLVMFNSTELYNTSTHTSGLDTDGFVHAVIPDGTYEWYINASDNSSNINETPRRNFTIDNIAPILMKVNITLAGVTVMNVSFNSSESVNFTINYSLNKDLSSGSEVEFATYKHIHEINITGLSPSLTYFYNVTITDRAGNSVVNGTFNFTTTGSSSQDEEDQGGSSLPAQTISSFDQLIALSPSQLKSYTPEELTAFINNLQLTTAQVIQLFAKMTTAQQSAVFGSLSSANQIALVEQKLVDPEPFCGNGIVDPWEDRFNCPDDVKFDLAQLFDPAFLKQAGFLKVLFYIAIGGIIYLGFTKPKKR